MKRLIIIIVFATFSCQNETVDDKLYWVQQIDNTILKYEKATEIESSMSFIENDIETTIKFYKKNPEGFYKIKATHYNVNFIDITQELYIKNNNILMNKLRGFSPIIYKRQKSETEPCCSLSERLVYFKNNDEAKVFVKELKVMALNNDKEKFNEELRILPLVEEDTKNVNDAYKSAKQQLDWFKNKFK